MPRVELAFRLAQGEFTLDLDVACEARAVALYGPSGSGKTSALEAIAGLRRPQAGRIAIDGHVLFDHARGIDVPVERRRIGYVFQDGRLFPHMTVRANLLYGEHAAHAVEHACTALVEGDEEEPREHHQHDDPAAAQRREHEALRVSRRHRATTRRASHRCSRACGPNR